MSDNNPNPPLTTPLFYKGDTITTTLERAGAFLNSGESLKILEDMFTVFDGSKTRKNIPFLRALSAALVHIEYPTFDDVWKYVGRAYSENTKKQNRSWIKKSGWLDGDTFGVRFWNEYQTRWTQRTEKKERLTMLKAEAPLRHEYDVDENFDYENTMDVIRSNPRIKYRLPDLPVKRLNYYDTSGIQIVKLNHVGGNPVVQLPLSYHYRCDGCGSEYDLPYDVKKVACKNEECGRFMTRVKSQDLIRPAYASRVVADDMNSIAIVSLSEIPQGEFIGAVFLCRNKSDYYLFMIATEEIEPAASTISITDDKHAIWQIIEQIDQQHEERIGKHIHGMDWYKAAILLAYLANCRGRISTNVLILGDSGIGKTATPRLYMATLTPQQKVQDAMNLTGPGLHGSMSQIKIGDSTLNVPEAGLLARYKLVCIDEMLDNRNKLLAQLKTALMSTTLTREIHGMRTQTPKYATAIATSNPIPEVLMEQQKWEGRWILENYDGEVSEFSESAAHDAMVEEWTTRGLDWRSGQPLADMDRWVLAFYVRDEKKIIHEYDLEGDDGEIDDLKLAKLLYDKNIDEYFNFCSRIKVDWKPHTSRIKELVKELQEHDHLHSKRIGQHITLMLQLSAQINGRSQLTDEDFDFVKELWLKTCEWIDVNELVHDPQSRPAPPHEWNIAAIKKEIHTRMKDFKGAPKFYMTPRGFALIAAEIEDLGADPELVSVVIEKYKENPDQ